MGECKYHIWNREIAYGQYQCSACEPVADFCLIHKDLHIELHPSHKDYIVDKETLIKHIFGSVSE